MNGEGLCHLLRRKGNLKTHRFSRLVTVHCWISRGMPMIFFRNVILIFLSNDRYVDSGLPFLILLHPALGPAWKITRQKFSGGSISKGSELQVKVQEFLWTNVQIEGA